MEFDIVSWKKNVNKSRSHNVLPFICEVKMIFVLWFCSVIRSKVCLKVLAGESYNCCTIFQKKVFRLRQFKLSLTLGNIFIPTSMCSVQTFEKIILLFLKNYELLRKKKIAPRGEDCLKCQDIVDLSETL